jgi:hypothetical protein
MLKKKKMWCTVSQAAKSPFCFPNDFRKLRKAHSAFRTTFAGCEKPILLSNDFRRLRKAHSAFRTTFASCGVYSNTSNAATNSPKRAHDFEQLFSIRLFMSDFHLHIDTLFDMILSIGQTDPFNTK